MDFSWILLALFLVALIRGVTKALSKSMLKNLLRLGSVAIAFLITFILQISGAFQSIVTAVLGAINLASLLPIPAAAFDLIYGLASTLVGPLLFIIVFFPILWILRIIIHFVVKGIEKNAAKKAEAAPVAENAERAAESAECAAENAECVEPAEESAEPATEEENAESAPTEDGAEAEPTEEEPKAEAASVTEEPAASPEKAAKPKKTKKPAIYPECAWKRAISLATGAISGLLVLAVVLMPVFYYMSIASSATDALDGSDADDSQIYQLTGVVDKYVVDPYEKSFVHGFYDILGISDLLNFTTKAGGKISLDNGKTVYADDVLKGLISNGLSAVVQLTSAKSECADIKENIENIISDPMVSTIVSDVVMDLIADLEIEEAEEGDLMGGLVNNFLQFYKDADKATIEKDLQAVGGAVGVLAEEKVIAQLMGGGDISGLLEDGETLGNVVEAISGLSAFGPTIEGAFELGIDMLGETLNIPENDAEAYDIFIDELLTQMVKKNNTTFDKATIQKYIYRCATENGGKLSAKFTGYNMFLNYVSHWERVQTAFAHASEDKSSGWFTMEINGQIYIYDKVSMTIIAISDENIEQYKDNVSPISGVINALALKSSTKQLTRDNLYTLLNAYVASASDEASLEVANRILAKDGFVSKAVTVEKLLAATNFSDWTEEEKANDSRLCVEIVMDLLGIMDTLGNMDSTGDIEDALDFVDQFVTVGTTMDLMKQTTCINELPPLLIEGLVKNEMLSTYMSSATVFKINGIVESNKGTYADCMNQIAINIEFAIKAVGGIK